MKLGIDPNKVWFVIRTNIKAEEKARRNLIDAGYDVYLPTFRVEKFNKRSHTYREIERPLMLRYLFLGQPRHNADWFTVRKCEGVESVLGDPGGSYIPVPHEVVERIYLAEFNMEFDDTRKARKHRHETVDRRFPKGARVFVKEFESVLSGIAGNVVETDGVKKVRILFDGLGKAWVEVDKVERAA